MAWHPPIFPGDWTSFPPSTFPALGLSPPMPPAASPWPNPASSFTAAAPLTSPDTPSEDRPSPFVSQSSIDNIGGLFSRDPSMPYGLFPYPFDTSPGSTSRFGGEPSAAGGLEASAATPATPGLFPAPGWPPVESFLPPFPPLPNPFAVGSPAPDSASGLSPSPNGNVTTPTAPPRSVLFNQPQPSWDFDSALIARRRAAAALDAGADELGAGELPRSKSGAPVASSPPSFSAAPPLSFEPPGWRDIAHWLSPNIVDSSPRRFRRRRRFLRLPPKSRARIIRTAQVRRPNSRLGLRRLWSVSPPSRSCVWRESQRRPLRMRHSKPRRRLRRGHQPWHA